MRYRVSFVMVALVAALCACSSRGTLPTSAPATVAADSNAAVGFGNDAVEHAGPTPSPAIPTKAQTGRVYHPSFVDPAYADITVTRPVGIPYVLPQLTGQTNEPLNKISTPDGSGQGGDGMFHESQNGDGSVYVAMSLRMLTLHAPAFHAINRLYAPTTHGPNGNCLETTTMYSIGGGLKITYHDIMIADFCDVALPGWVVDVQVNANFFNRYVRYWSNGNHLPQYISESVLGRDQAWHAYFYDALTKKWDEYYRSKPNKRTNFVEQQGWSIFETHYETNGPTQLPHPVACPSVVVLGESGLRIHTQGKWAYPHVIPYNGGSCFVNPNGKNVGAYYHLDYQPGDVRWKAYTE